MSNTALPPGWAWAALADLGTWYGGGTPSKARPEFWHGGTIPWLSPKDMGTEVVSATKDRITEAALSGSSVRLVPAGSVAIVMRSGILERTVPIASVPFVTTLNQDMKALFPHEGISPQWVAWVLRSMERRIMEKCKKDGTTVASLSTDALMDLKVPIAPIAEQCRILETLDDHLSRLDSANNLLAHAKSLSPVQSRSLYTAASEGRMSGTPRDLVPDFRGIRQGLWDSTNSSKKYKAPAAADLSAAPHLPEGWAVYSLEELTDPIRIIRYGILMPKVKSAGVVPYVEVKDLGGCTLRGKELHRTSKELDEKFAGARVVPGDVLLAVRGSYDRSAVAPKALAGANVSRDVARIAPLPGVDSEYLHIYIQSRFAQQYLKNHARGVAVKGVNIATIRAMPVAVPPLSTQREIVEVVQQRKVAVDVAIAAVARSSHRSVALRQAILARAFSGRLVEQDPGDEPASVVLQRIGAERKRVVSRGVGKASARSRRQTHAEPVAPKSSFNFSQSALGEMVQQEFEL
ncbi:restriction endonuclease subunit S [Streptomyces hydrogenans]|uniref:restriction endonuclease subunit S n=1 Tax=Streptomyces hydrogenans TaxID=1873719 RepID=UPI0035D88113